MKTATRENVSALSQKLEAALLYAIAQGALSVDRIDVRRLSLYGKVFVKGLRALRKRTPEPKPLTLGAIIEAVDTVAGRDLAEIDGGEHQMHKLVEKTWKTPITPSEAEDLLVKVEIVDLKVAAMNASAEENFSLAQEKIEAARRLEEHGRETGLQYASDIEVAPVSWLWPGRIPRGMVTLLVGDPEGGKTLSAVDIVARLSRGRAFPDGSPSRKTVSILLSAEDTASQTIKPRLLVAGADCTKVSLIATDVTTGLPPLSLLANDVPRIEQMIDERSAEVLVIDPVNAYLPGKVDANRDNAVRSALAPFAALAGRKGIAVIGIMHLSKNADRTVLQRVLGSTAFSALARAVFAVVPDAEDRERRLFLCAKMNIAKKPSGLAFTVESRIVKDERGRAVLDKEGNQIEAPLAVWEKEEVSISADEALRQLTKPSRPRQEAETAIEKILEDGPVVASVAEQELARSRISERTAMRAKNGMGVESEKVMDVWYWFPPQWAEKKRSEWARQERKRLRAEKRADREPIDEPKRGSSRSRSRANGDDW